MSKVFNIKFITLSTEISITWEPEDGVLQQHNILSSENFIQVLTY